MTSRADRASPASARAEAEWHPLYRIGGLAALVMTLDVLGPRRAPEAGPSQYSE
ncbi:hypothetical protein BJQ94_17230 [Cryobacterium sp. SO2]|uniref:hypothetical protein n=1 Tax=Cryobacterium sp. SO2 TaxID=1897060 RepID=UPI00223D525D|nr:hypothetical protein [Cryobacterium sp. SO2]WEO77071.1 hypothetical protein BJQ94_17230 [Cryobacterium sp. SO2]